MDAQTVGGMPGIVIFLLGLLAGGALAYLLLPSRKGRQLQQKLEEQVRENARYRAQVTEHFGKTAELVNAMTQSYKAVYDHLAEGAQSLCQDETVNPALKFSEPRLIGGQSTAPEQAAPPPAQPTPAPAQPAAQPAAPPPPADHVASPGEETPQTPARPAAAPATPPQAPRDYAPEAEPSR